MIQSERPPQACSSIAQAMPGPKLHYLPLWAEQFLSSGTIEALPEIWKWRYTRLLVRSWDAELPCFLPNDSETICRLMGAPESDMMDANFSKVLEKFPVTSDQRHRYNPRLLAEYQRAREEYDGRSARGKAGADARWSRRQPRAQAMPEHMPKQCLSNANNNDNDKNPDADGITAVMAASGLLSELGVAGEKMLREVADVIAMETAAPCTVRDHMLSAWRAYQSRPNQDGKGWGVRNFFAHGEWRNWVTKAAVSSSGEIRERVERWRQTASAQGVEMEGLSQWRRIKKYLQGEMLRADFARMIEPLWVGGIDRTSGTLILLAPSEKVQDAVVAHCCGVILRAIDHLGMRLEGFKVHVDKVEVRKV